MAQTKLFGCVFSLCQLYFSGVALAASDIQDPVCSVGHPSDRQTFIPAFVIDQPGPTGLETPSAACGFPAWYSLGLEPGGFGCAEHSLARGEVHCRFASPSWKVLRGIDRMRGRVEKPGIEECGSATGFFLSSKSAARCLVNRRIRAAELQAK